MLMVLRTICLTVACIAAIRVRLYNIERFGIYIDENAPYHNFRAAKVMSEVGTLRDWYDTQSWHPIGTPQGGTAGSFPGLILTASMSHRLINFVWQPLAGSPLSMYHLCVFLPVFSAVAATLAAYGLAKEISTTNNTPTQVAEARGLFAAGFLAIVPGYVYRSVAGLYDHESIGIPAMLLCCYLWCRACRKGTIGESIAFAFSFSYLASVWSMGSLFVGFAVPTHVLMLWFMVEGKDIHNVYSAFTVGIPLSLTLSVIFAPFITEGTPWTVLCGCTVCLAYAMVQWSALRVSSPTMTTPMRVLSTVTLLGLFVVIGYNWLFPLLCRLASPSGFAPNTAVARSISSDKATTWAQFFIDMHLLAVLFPAGLSSVLLRQRPDKYTDDVAVIFFVICAMFAMVLTSMRASAMPLLAAWSSVAAAMVLGEFVVVHVHIMLASSTVMSSIDIMDESKQEANSSNNSNNNEPTAKNQGTSNRKKSTQKNEQRKRRGALEEREAHSGHLYLSTSLLLGLGFALTFFWWHCTWISYNMYSVPSIVVPAKDVDGKDTSFDDFREAYTWIDKHTPPNSKVLAWWDYGYQLTTLANRTTIVDNMAPSLDPRTQDGQRRLNQLSDVSKMFISKEDVSWSLMQQYDVDYVMVVFGGMTGYVSDDVNNFLWMANIAKEKDTSIRTNAFLSRSKSGKRTSFTVGKKAPKALTESALYKMCYYGWGNVKTDFDQPAGYDRVRKETVDTHVNKLKHFEEKFTSKHWMVRLFKVLPPPLV